MTVLCSLTTGLLLDSAQTSLHPLFLNGDESASWDTVETLHVLSTVHDWQVIGDKTDAVTIEQLTRDYWARRCSDISRCLLSGVSGTLEDEILAYLESLLGSRASRDLLLSYLLVAPLQVPNEARRLAQRALGLGLSIVGQVFDDLCNTQPLIQRLADLWLSLPPQLFLHLEGTRQHLWVRLSESGVLRRILEAGSTRAFCREWNALVWQESIPASRSAVGAVGVAIAEKLLGGGALVSTDPDSALPPDAYEETDDDSPARQKTFSWEQSRDRALKQIRVIVEEIAATRDSKARDFLEQLVASQVAESGTEYAVKTLCNIAQSCKDLFRTDFEAECLAKARGLAPTDVWTLIQISDLHKREGRFGEALTTATEAAAFAASEKDYVIARSMIADVWSEQHQYDEAIAIYKSISGWESNHSVRMAIADNLRRKGLLREAEQQYDALLEGAFNDRAMAGKAEIAKHRGELQASLVMYERILTDIPHADVGKSAWVIYSLSLASILKMLGRLEDALNTVDDVVQKAPFSVQARIQRSTLLALMGNPSDGLAGIETLGSTAALGQWILEYVRGLILLKLHRFEDARQQLVEKMNRTLGGGDSEVLLRVGAAIVFLIGDQVAEAESVIVGVGTGQKYYERYLLHVLRLHIAVVADDEERVRAILAALEASDDCDKSLTAAVYELKLAARQDSKRERLTRALNHQVDFLLRAA